MAGEVLDNGLLGGLLIALAGGLVQFFLWRLRMRTAVRVKGIGLKDSREARTLDAEEKAFGYLRDALERAQKEEDELRQELEETRERLHEREMTIIRLRDEYQAREFEMTSEIKFLQAAVGEIKGREMELRFRLVQMDSIARDQRRDLWDHGIVKLEPLPVLPAWIRLDDRKAISEGEPPYEPPHDEDD